MTNSVNTNQSALIALQNLNSINKKLSDTQVRVSTGLKVGGAKDNAATWAIAQNQRADSGALASVKSSLDRATSIADVAMAAGEQISELLIELRQKATSASDPSSTDATRTAYDNDFQSLLRSIASFASNAKFDGENILDGNTADPLLFLASADAAETITMNRQDLSLVTLGLDGLDLLDPTQADTVLDAVEAALQTTTAALAALGAESKQISAHNIFVGKLMDSLETGVGNLVDADLAKESARLQALQVQQQLGVQALSIANQTPQTILSLFGN
jgi:flagellin